MGFNMRFEMFNVFNHANFTVWSATPTVASSVRPPTPCQARIGQISAKFIF